MRNKHDKPEQSALNKEVKNIYKRFRQGFYRPNLLLTLEKRQMFDGAAGAIVSEEMLDPLASGAEEQLPTPDTSSASASSNAADDAVPADSSNEPASTPSSTEVSTDSSIAAETPSNEVEVATDSQVDNENVSSADGAFVDTDSDGIADFDESADVDSDALIDDDLLDGAGTTAVAIATTSQEPAIQNNQAEVAQQNNQNAPPATAQSENLPEEVSVVPDQEEADESTTITDIAPVDADDNEIRQVVFIDTAVAGYEDLLDGIVSDLTAELDTEVNADDDTGIGENESLEELLSGFAYEQIPVLQKSP